MEIGDKQEFRESVGHLSQYLQTVAVECLKRVSIHIWQPWEGQFG